MSRQVLKCGLGGGEKLKWVSQLVDRQGQMLMLTAMDNSYTQLIGQSDAVRSLHADIECAARSDAKVLITGETGVGKEVVARLIHERSARASGPLLTVNCAGLPDTLLESELFGHVRGSFTDAYRDKPGLLESAGHGTVFLDEVGEMSPRMQAVLLRFLETGELQRIGATRPHTRRDVRLITATNRDLQAQIAAGVFREDLYFRLNVIHICIPPLRQRAGDIPELFAHYLDVYSRHHRAPYPQLTAGAMQSLLERRWTGNVRELKNVAERLVLKQLTRPVLAEDLPNDDLATAAATRRQPAAADAAPRRSIADELTEQMLGEGLSFWSTVYPAFMAHDLTRDDLRNIVKRGLESSAGNYRGVVERFNMRPDDYKRFLKFLRKHDCHVLFQRFRTLSGRFASASAQDRPAAPEKGGAGEAERT